VNNADGDIASTNDSLGVGWKWWLLAPGVLIAVHLSRLMINIALGARIVNTEHVASLGFKPTNDRAVVNAE